MQVKRICIKGTYMAVPCINAKIAGVHIADALPNLMNFMNNITKVRSHTDSFFPLEAGIRKHFRQAFRITEPFHYEARRSTCLIKQDILRPGNIVALLGQRHLQHLIELFLRGISMAVYFCCNRAVSLHQEDASFATAPNRRWFKLVPVLYQRFVVHWQAHPF